MAKIGTLTMPASWASYLINGDASGITARERWAADAYLEGNEVKYVLDAPGEPYFSWWFWLPGGEYDGGDLLDYTVEFQ